MQGFIVVGWVWVGGVSTVGMLYHRALVLDEWGGIGRGERKRKLVLVYRRLVKEEGRKEGCGGREGGRGGRSTRDF